MNKEKTENLDYDYIIIGSGFGGSVSAMRLSQKGYKVAVIESGKRWKKEDFAERNWNLYKYLWMPNIFLHGIQRMNILNDIFILSGSGVGGGSLNYANTLYVPPDKFFENDIVKNRFGGKEKLLPYYELAKKMLGVTENPVLNEVDNLMKETAADFGKEDTFSTTPVGIYFGEEGKEASDPYFLGEGPDRIGCELCGACMTGCKKDAKNTLDKNYLYFAEKFGAEIIPESKVIDVVTLNRKKNGSEGYEITTINTTALFPKRRKKYTAKGVVFSAGVLGTHSLLMEMKEKKRLPNLSDDLGKFVRTNSEAILTVKSRSNDVDYSKGVAITSSVHPDEHTHIEPVRYAKGNDVMGSMAVLMTAGGDKKTSRIINYLKNIIKNPLDFLNLLLPLGSAHKSIILLVMQTHDNYINIVRKRRFIWPFSKTLTSTQASVKKNPVYIPIANEFCGKYAKKIDGIACSVFTEVYMNTPITAHIMGGCNTANSSGNGVIDEKNKVRGYDNMLVVDASMIPANLGVNPALSITALSERAMSFIPVKDDGKFKGLKVDIKWGIKKLLLPKV